MPTNAKAIHWRFGSVYTKQNTHSKLYSIDKSIKVNCTNGKEQKKSYVKNNAEVTCNWGTEYKSETYKYTTFYMYIKQEKSQILILGIL